jgi:ectoine hydroxylase-related dioxygenase (phytanoyl-CoA dioxygenase family)
MQTFVDNSLHQQIDQRGFAIVPGIIEPTEIAALLDTVGSFQRHQAIREKSGSTYAVRRLCELVPQVAQLAASSAIRSLITPILGNSARVVRSLLFDKTADANWKVPWHQDITIAVKERHDTAGFGPWSVKTGVPHVQPPARVLENMLTLRLHLDDCGPENGPLRVLPGTHKMGLVDSANINVLRQDIPEFACTVSRGDILLMRPLLLHASSSAQTPGHRRVIHLEFAASDLPGDLHWNESCL